MPWIASKIGSTTAGCASLLDATPATSDFVSLGTSVFVRSSRIDENLIDLLSLGLYQDLSARKVCNHKEDQRTRAILPNRPAFLRLIF